jgi:hypothetical protein
MLQSVATLGSLLIAAAMLAVIAGILVDDWRTILQALRARRAFASPLPGLGRKSSDRRACVVRVSSQSAPQRAVA